jgi:hypothetical protein
MRAGRINGCLLDGEAKIRHQSPAMNAMTYIDATMPGYRQPCAVVVSLTPGLNWRVTIKRAPFGQEGPS